VTRNIPDDMVKEALAQSFSVAYCWVLTGTTTDRLMGLKSESRIRLEQQEVTKMANFLP